LDKLLSRLGAGFSLALIFCAPVLAQGRMEVVAGTNRFVEIPGPSCATSSGTHYARIWFDARRTGIGAA
jgi:hypothetical protein